MPARRATDHEDLASYANGLAELLYGLRMLPPRGTEGEWLAQAKVQDALLWALCKVPDVAIKRHAAAWLQRAALSEKNPVGGIWPRRTSVSEMLAGIASDMAWEEETRQAAWLALRHGDLMVRLFQLGERYEALVYDLLLAMGRRCTANTRPGHGCLSNDGAVLRAT